MKKTLFTLVVIFIAQYVSYAQCCNKTEDAKTTAKTCCSADSSKTETTVTAYYFHTSRRCETCKAVEAVSQEAIQEYTKCKVPFSSIDIEEQGQQALVEKYQVSGQTLLIVSNGENGESHQRSLYERPDKPGQIKSKD